MISKTIHYCWFGRGEMSSLMKKCVKSWKKYCPDYEIIEWNEDNFDINSTIWTKQAYEAKKYAFVADYVRLYVLSKYGGVYMDTDVELLKPIDEYLVHEAFSGFENTTTVSSGIIGAISHQAVIEDWLEYYKNRSYLIDGKVNMEPNVIFMTEYLNNKGLQMNDSLQCIDGMVIYPQTYFCPLSVVSIEQKFSKHTVAVHHFTSTWRTEKALKDFARVRRHQRKWYRACVWLRYLPNRVVRRIFGDGRIDDLKQRLGKN